MVFERALLALATSAALGAGAQHATHHGAAPQAATAPGAGSHGAAQHGPQSGTAPYAGQQSRDIKALSEDEVQGYLAGAGMGFAKAAELNRYPGPMHALEHAQALGLSDEQRTRLEALMHAHKREARQLGTDVVRLERELDRLFAQRSATAPAVDAKLAEIGAAQAKVRGSHLRTHLEATALLTPEQVERYVRLRGYR
jgi:Spy/CpxP family protein refolding chaperone